MWMKGLVYGIALFFIRTSSIPLIKEYWKYVE